MQVRHAGTPDNWQIPPVPTGWRLDRLNLTPAEGLAPQVDYACTCPGCLTRATVTVTEIKQQDDGGPGQPDSAPVELISAETLEKWKAHAIELRTGTDWLPYACLHAIQKLQQLQPAYTAALEALRPSQDAQELTMAVQPEMPAGPDLSGTHLRREWLADLIYVQLIGSQGVFGRSDQWISELAEAYADARIRNPTEA